MVHVCVCGCVYVYVCVPADVRLSTRQRRGVPGHPVLLAMGVGRGVWMWGM